MRALILGATGLLGKVLAGDWNGDTVISAGSREADIRDRSQLQALFSRSQPECTVLAAAYTDVDGCERDPKRAHEVNFVGAVNVAQVARDFRSRLLFISTDYVFDGSKTMPYEPNDLVCPVNAYGASKAEAEGAIREILPGCCIVRTSWLFGASGKCFPNTILNAAAVRGSLRVVNDQVGCPTFNRDLSRAIVALVRTGAQGTVHVTNRGVCTWYQFACGLVRAAGMTHVTVTPVTSSEFPLPARRPAYSVLSPASLDLYGIPMRTWQESLDDYFKERQTVSPERPDFAPSNAFSQKETQ